MQHEGVRHRRAWCPSSARRGFLLRASGGIDGVRGSTGRGTDPARTCVRRSGPRMEGSTRRRPPPSDRIEACGHVEMSVHARRRRGLPQSSALRALYPRLPLARDPPARIAQRRGGRRTPASPGPPRHFSAAHVGEDVISASPICAQLAISALPRRGRRAVLRDAPGSRRCRSAVLVRVVLELGLLEVPGSARWLTGPSPIPCAVMPWQLFPYCPWLGRSCEAGGLTLIAAMARGRNADGPQNQEPFVPRIMDILPSPPDAAAVTAARNQGGLRARQTARRLTH